MTTTTLKVKNGTIKLPKALQNAWKQAEVILFPSDDTIIVKKVQKPTGKLSGIARRVSSPPMNAQELNKEVAAYRKSK
jgi:hypothetical protein